ncbi:MAG: translation initiation factor [Planctomycetota bacterium]
MGLFDGTELERPVLCERCGDDIKVCGCEPILQVESEPEITPEKQSLRVRVEKRKRGKLMTVVAGFRGSQQQRQSVLTELKNTCGAGGTIDDGNVEIQGDHKERVCEHLKKMGFRAK